MKSTIFFLTACKFMLLSLFLISCSSSNELTSEVNINGFINPYNSFHNEYYKNNNIKEVSVFYDNNLSIKRVYHYNTLGDLHKFETINIDDHGNEVLDETDSLVYDLTYVDGLLQQISYHPVRILTHSIVTYENGLITKVSDYRSDELYYFTDYVYQNKILSYSKETRLNSAGVRFGTSPVTFEHNYFYNDNGNLLRTDVSYQSRAFEEGAFYEYLEDSDLPNKTGGANLTYTYFQ